MLLRGRRYDDMKPLRLSKMAPKPEQPFVKTKKYCMTMSTALSGGSKCNALVSEQRLEIYLKRFYERLAFISTFRTLFENEKRLIIIW